MNRPHQTLAVDDRERASLRYRPGLDIKLGLHCRFVFAGHFISIGQNIGDHANDPRILLFRAGHILVGTIDRFLGLIFDRGDGGLDRQQLHQAFWLNVAAGTDLLFHFADPVLGFLTANRENQCPGDIEHQIEALAKQLGRQLFVPAHQQKNVAGGHQVPGQALDKADGLGGVAGGDRMIDGLGHVAVGREPFRRPAMKLVAPPVGQFFKLGQQKIPQQQMQPGPTLLVLKRQEQRQVLDHVFDDRRRIVAAEDRVAKFRAESLEYGRTNQPFPFPRVELFVNDLADVPGNLLGAGAQPVNDFTDRLAVVFLERLAGKVEAGHPAFGDPVKPVDIAQSQIAKPLQPKQFRRFLDVEADVADIDFLQSTRGPQPGQREIRWPATGQHKMKIGRGVMCQLLENLSRALRLQQMHVIEHDEHLGIQPADPVDDEADRMIGRQIAGRQNRCAISRSLAQYSGPLHRPQNVGDKLGNLIVTFIEAQPGNAMALHQQPLTPAGKQGGLAIARRRRDHGDGELLEALEEALQMGALGNHRWSQPRGQKPGFDQHAKMVPCACASVQTSRHACRVGAAGTVHGRGVRRPPWLSAPTLNRASLSNSDNRFRPSPPAARGRRRRPQPRQSPAPGTGP